MEQLLAIAGKPGLNKHRHLDRILLSQVIGQRVKQHGSKWMERCLGVQQVNLTRAAATFLGHGNAHVAAHLLDSMRFINILQFGLLVLPFCIGCDLGSEGIPTVPQHVCPSTCGPCYLICSFKFQQFQLQLHTEIVSVQSLFRHPRHLTKCLGHVGSFELLQNKKRLITWNHVKHVFLSGQPGINFRIVFTPEPA